MTRRSVLASAAGKGKDPARNEPAKKGSTGSADSGMTLERKYAALMALSRFELRMRHLGNFYFSSSEIETTKPGSSILSGDYGNGSTPEEAIANCWDVLTSDPAKYIVLHAMIPEKRRAVRWNGFMWSEVREDER